MQETPWQEYWQKIRPSLFDTLVCALATLMILMVALLPTLVTKYQLFTVENAVLARMAHGLTKFLVGIDNMKFSATILTFLFWGLIGLVTYGFVMGLIRFWQRAEEFEEMVSEEFVHPAGFNTRHYWRTLALREGLNIMILLIALICVSLTIFALLPAATVHARTVVLNSSWTALIQSVAAGLLLWVGATLITLCFKAWHYRHILRPAAA